MIDLRSDTVTKPTLEMRNAMFTAKVGDDVYEEDTTMKRLEKRVTTLFGKESALFFPSGTMSNLTAIMAWCSKRGSEIIVGDKSHIFLYEQSGASQFGGVSYRTVTNLADGSMDISTILESIREKDIHESSTELICIENTHNVCGGKILPEIFMVDLQEIAREKNIPIHLDGARIWNALTKTNTEPAEMAKYVDSLTVCLSKGLGAPIGSLLIGKKTFIEKARRIRKALGGGMRQTGILAAAGLKALDDFEAGILAIDHLRCKRIADTLNKNPYHKWCQIDDTIDTNILFIKIITERAQLNVSSIEYNASKIANMFRKKNILVSVWSPTLLRMVFHRDLKDKHIEKIEEAIFSISLYYEFDLLVHSKQNKNSR
jgi:threonine aldolase